MKRGTLPIIAAFGIIACVEILPHVWAGVALPAKTDANKIQGKRVEAPTAGDDGSALVYINASSAYKHRPNAAASVAGKLDEATFAAYTSQDRLLASIFAAYTSVERAGVTTHESLTGKDASDQHPISSITNLQSSLDDKLGKTIFDTYTSTERLTVAAFTAYTSLNRAGEGGVVTHESTTGRDSADQHPISSITDLQSTLNAKQSTVTGGATTITGSDLTASRALVSNTSGKVATSSVTSTEISYLSGVTSLVQNQFNGKIGTSTAFGGDVSGTYGAIVVGDDTHNHTSSTIPSNSFTAAGLVTSGAGNASKVWKTDGSGNPAWRDDLTGSSPTFDTVGGGTNTSSTMTLGSGGTLTYSGTGVVNASKYKGETGPSAVEFAYLSDLESAILEVNDVVNNLTAGGTAVPLSAEQGKVLNTAFKNYTTTDRLPVSAFTSYTSAGGGRVTQDEVAAGYSPLAKTANYIDAKADFGCTGDGSTDDTTCITNALASAVSTGRPLKFIDGIFKTSGGFLIDDPITLVGENATFRLSANATLFDVSVIDNVRMGGFAIEVPDANTATTLRVSSSYSRAVGRGWGPIRNHRYHDIKIYTASAIDWDPTTGAAGDVSLEPAWTGIEFWIDTTDGRSGINYVELENIHIEFPYYGIKNTKAGTTPANNAWMAGNSFKNIVIHGAEAAYYSREVNFNANTFNHFMIHPLRNDANIGLDWDAWCNSNVVEMQVFNDSGWNGQTRGDFNPLSFNGGVGNIVTGYLEYSTATPPSGLEDNTVIADLLETDTSLWSPPTNVNQYKSIAQIRAPVAIKGYTSTTTGAVDDPTALKVVREYTSTGTSNIMSVFDVYGDIVRFMARSANGTEATPTKKLADDVLFAFGARGHTGSGWPSFATAQMQFQAEENMDTGLGTNIRFLTTAAGNPAISAPTLALKINSGQRSIFSTNGAYSDDGTSRVQVDGTVKATAFAGDGSGLTGIGSAVNLASIAAGGTVSCDNTIVTITSGAAGADTTLPADCIAGKILTVKNSSGAAQDIIAASGYIDDTPGLEWRIPSTGTGQFISEGTTLGWQAVKHPIPDCDNATTSKLLYDVTTNTYTCGTDQTGSGIAVNDTSVTISDTGTGSSITTTVDNVPAAIFSASTYGIGTITPQKGVDIYGGVDTREFMVRREKTLASGGGLVYLFHNNAKSGPDFVLPSAADRLGGLVFGSFSGTESAATARNGGAILAYAEDEYVGGTDHSTNIRFETTPVDSATRAERLRIQADGKLRMSNQSAPATTTTACTAGTFTFVNDYLYLCTATDTWKRVQITGTW